MRIEAHYGPAPIRKEAAGNPIVAWLCEDAPRTQTSPPNQHVTMFYLNDGDQIIPQAQQLLNQFAPSRSIQVQAPMEIAADANGSPIIWLTLPDTFTNYAALLLKKFTQAGLQASQDRSSGPAISHITIDRPPYGDQAQQTLNKLKGQYSGVVTLQGPMIFNSAGQPMTRSSARVSSFMDLTIDMLEMLN